MPRSDVVDDPRTRDRGGERHAVHVETVIARRAVPARGKSPLFAVALTSFYRVMFRARNSKLAWESVRSARERCQLLDYGWGRPSARLFPSCLSQSCVGSVQPDSFACAVSFLRLLCRPVCLFEHFFARRSKRCRDYIAISFVLRWSSRSVSFGLVSTLLTWRLAGPVYCTRSRVLHVC